MRQKKMILVLTLTAAVSLLAVAGKLIADKNKGHRIAGTELPSAKEEYARLIRKFISPDSTVQMTGNVTVLDGAQPNVEKERSSFQYVRKGRNFYSSLSFMQTFFNGKFMVQLDSLHKVIFISQVNDSTQTQPGLDPVLLSNKLFSDTASFKVSGTVSGDDKLRILTIASDFNPEIQNFTISYSPADYSMKSAEVRFYKNGRRVEGNADDGSNVWISKVDYKESQMKDLDMDGMISKIFVIRQGQIVPTASYINYRVIIK